MRTRYKLIRDAIEKGLLPEEFIVGDVVRCFEQHHPEARRNRKSLQNLLPKMSVNMRTQHQSRRAAQPENMCLYSVDRGQYTRYQPKIHGIWESGEQVSSQDDGLTQA